MQNTDKQLCNEPTQSRRFTLTGTDEFMATALSYSLKLYRNNLQGTLEIELTSTGATTRPSGAIALITEHRPFESGQHTLRFNDGDAVATRLPAGEYTVTVCAKGFQPFRAFVTIGSGTVSTLKAQLQQQDSKGLTFEQVLAKNLIKRDMRSIRDLTVEAGTTVVLDPASSDLSMDLERVELRTLKDVKTVLGSPDSAFVGEYPRFGRFAPASRRANNRLSSALDLASRAALNEYVYGNSRSVVGWEQPLNQWISAEEINVNLWVLNNIDVGPHSVLVVTSNGLLCNKLSVHYTGQVRLQGPGPIKLEMNHYVRYFGEIAVRNVETQSIHS
jgi:hypothetical protein